MLGASVWHGSQQAGNSNSSYVSENEITTLDDSEDFSSSTSPESRSILLSGRLN